MHDKKMRRLIWIPIIHTQADLGSLSESVREVYVRKIGHGKWQEHARAVEEMWREIRTAVHSLSLTWNQVRLYQDGLAHCGHEVKIVNDLAHAGSENHRILLDLMARGASITGTESPELLLQEYELARRVMTSREEGAQARAAQLYNEKSQNLLARRDSYIAQRIDETLRPGETGLVFLGMLHSLDGRLAPDIGVTTLGGHASYDGNKGEADPAKQGRSSA